MYETDLVKVRAKALEAVMNALSYESDSNCRHDDYTFCPEGLARIISLFNIYPIELIQRISSYKQSGVDFDGIGYSVKEYWKFFLEHLIQDPNDFQVLKQ